MKSQMLTLGEKIQSLLDEKGWSQAALADAAGINRTTLNQIIKNTIKGSRTDTIAKIAAALGVSTDYLTSSELGGVPDSEKRLTGEERAILAVHGLAKRHGWEEIARKLVEVMPEGDGFRDSEPRREKEGPAKGYEEGERI